MIGSRFLPYRKNCGNNGRAQISNFGKDVAANRQQLGKHFDGVAYRVDLAAFPMEGLDRDLFNAIVEQAGDEQNLGVKSPILNPLHAEYSFGCIEGKCFKSALSILESQSQNNAHHRSESSAANAAIKGWFYTLQLIV